MRPARVDVPAAMPGAVEDAGINLLGRRVSPRIIGIGALFSGAALLVHILAGWSLAVVLAFFTSLVAAGGVWVWRRASPYQRAMLARLARIGLLSGIAATITYDVSKYLLSQLDPTPFNPFEALRAFGAALIGREAPEAAIFAVGTAFHALNGTAFGVAFCMLFRQPNILLGIAWGLFLELFQLSLYPGWLSIRFYDEFVQVSALGHVVYGATLGWLCARGLRRGTPPKSIREDTP